MPSSKTKTEAPVDPDIEADYYPKLQRLDREVGPRAPPPRLAVTSRLHPFWYTKKGIAVIIVTILAIVGGVVGGVVGGKQGKNDTSRRNFGLPSSTATSTTASSTSANSISSALKSASTASSSELTSITARAVGRYVQRPRVTADVFSATSYATPLEAQYVPPWTPVPTA